MMIIDKILAHRVLMFMGKY